MEKAWKPTSTTSTELQVLLTSTLAMFSLVSHYIRQCDGMLVGPPKNPKIQKPFLLIWKLGQGLLKTGLLWTHCPQKAYFMLGLHSGDSGHHLLTPGPPLCYHWLPASTPHFSQPPLVTGLAELQGICSVALILWLFFVHTFCVCPCLHGWC